MWEEIFTLAMSNGIWTVLFCSLLFYQLKDSKKREEKYHAVIDRLTESLSALNVMNEKLDKMDDSLRFLAQAKTRKAENKKAVG